MSNYSPPVVKVTMRHASGGISIFRADEAHDLNDKDPVKEAIITVFATVQRQGRMEVIRSDMDGDDWESIRRAKAIDEMMNRLIASAKDLEGEETAKVVLEVGADGSMHNAELFTNPAKAEAAMAAGQNRRALKVPKDLPFQFGGTVEGATAVIFKPQEGGALMLHSLHPTHQEALMAEQYLRSQGQSKTGTLKVMTPVTSLLKDVLANAFRPSSPNPSADALAELNGERKAEKTKSPLDRPQAFARPTPFGAI